MQLVQLGLRRRILLAFAVAVAVFSIVGVKAWRIAGVILTNLDEVVESERQIHLDDDILRLTTDMDQAVRGFVYTGTPEHLARFDSATGRIGGVLDQLQHQLEGEPDQAAVAAALAPVIAAKIQTARAMIAARQGPGGQAAALHLMVTERSWRLTEQIRHALNLLRAGERRELTARNASLAVMVRRSRGAMSGAVVLTFVVTALGLFGVVREVGVRNRTKAALAASEARLRGANDGLVDLYEHAPCGYHSINTDGLVVRMNDTGLSWLGYAREEVVGHKHITDLITPEAAAGFRERLQQFRATGAIRDVEVEYLRKDGTRLPALMSSTAVHDVDGRFVMTRSVVTDITEVTRAREIQGRLIADLRAALANVKKLSGLLPICASCKKVRDDMGYWGSVERYISDHTDAKFSHGVCPDCFPKLFPGIPLPEPETAHV